MQELNQEGVCHQPLGGAWLTEFQPLLSEFTDCGIETW
jgi:hypothetical protein